MKTKFRTLFACCAAGALAVSLSACGEDDGSAPSSQLLSANGTVEPGWSMMDLAGVDPEFLGNDSANLPQALPMAASYSSGNYAYAPSYDYAPDRDSYYAPLDDGSYYDDGYYDDGYYEDGYYDGGYYDGDSYDAGYTDNGLYNLDGDGSDYALLALAVSLAGMIGDAPPDYGYAYDGVSPWAWQTGDGYSRYAEPIDGGYRYYYYEPDSYRPFLVSDPYYSYGYRDDRLVAIYDRGGRRVDARRADLQLRAAKTYYARADRLYEAAQRDRYGVPAPLWERQRGTIARERDTWFRKQAERPAWQRWEARNAPKLYREWSGEALVRRDAERNFTQWQRADYKTPPPAFYTPDVRRQQVRQVAELRRDRADEVAQRGRERSEQRAAQQRETQALAERADKARRDRTERLAERREQPAERRERGIAVSEIRERADRPNVSERIAERREERADRRAERPSVAQRVERARPAAMARPEPRRAEPAKARVEQRPRAVAERPIAKPRAAQVRREQPKAEAPAKRAQPAERVRVERQQPQARREAPAKRAEPRQAREVSQAAPAQRQRPERASRPEQTRAAPQPRVERAERQQAVQQRSEARQQARQERAAARQEAAPQPRTERSQPRQQARQEAAPQPRAERAQSAAQPQRAEAREERQEARAAKREERRQRPT
jgi:hypothetical protein